MQELVDNEQIEVVEHFKYIDSLKSADGNFNKDTLSRIGMAKKRMLDLVPIRKDRGINKDLKMKLVCVDSSHLGRRRLDSDKS